MTERSEPGRKVLLLAALRQPSGPAEKIRDYAGAFGQLGWDARAVIVEPDRRAVERLRRTLQRSDADLVVLRSHWTVPGLLPTLRRLRRQGVLVVIDSPSPVACAVHEVAGSARTTRQRAVRLAVETLWTPTGWTGADLVVQYGEEGEPWRRLARSRRLTLTNGIDVDRRPLATEWVTRESVTFAAAGAFGHWHGYDRLLRGMAAARGRNRAGSGTVGRAEDRPSSLDTSSLQTSSRDATTLVTSPLANAAPTTPPDGEVPIRLLLIGDGPALPSLRRLTTDLGLDNQVTFTGPLTGDALDEALAAADIGVGTLAEHRRGERSLSPLKTRDYLARGLPVLFAGDDPDLRDDPRFTMRVPGDDSPVDVTAAAAWLADLRAEGQLPATIRAAAQERFDITDRAAAILTALDFEAVVRRS